MNLREFIARLRPTKLAEVRLPVSPELEMACLIHALEERAPGSLVLFDQVRGHPGWRVLAGLCGSRRNLGLALGVSPDRLLFALAQAMEGPISPPPAGEVPCQEIVQRDVDLTRLPILTHLPADGGAYVTSGVVIIEDPDYGRNASFHRLLRLNERSFAARIVERRGTHAGMGKVAGDLPVAIAIGCPPHVLLAASMSPPMGIDELAVANSLVLTPVARCKTSDLQVPADAELILEGRITRQLASEGPFPDLTGTLDGVRQQPVIEIDCITHRREPIYHALLPAGLEHKLLMGMPREPTIYAAVAEAVQPLNVCVTPGGSSWLHAVVQIEKRGPDDGQRAIEAAFRGHSSLKHVVVVDRDVDPFNPMEVEWAIATRFQADSDLLVWTEQPGSSLDPSGRQLPGQKARTAKMGLDATIPWGRDRRGFERVQYGGADLTDYGLEVVGGGESGRT
jgi:2,5-furandicarboxylate decarboxylase 1